MELWSDCNWKGPRGIPGWCAYVEHPPPTAAAALHIHHCGVRPWGALVTMKFNSEIAPRPGCRLFKLWYKAHRRPDISWKLQHGVKHIHYTDGRLTRGAHAHTCVCVRVRVNTSAFGAWRDFNSDGSETESFLQMSSSQAWLHRRLSMHTARDKIKHSRLLSALKRPGPWSMWSPYLFIFLQDWPQTIRIQIREEREEHTSRK